MPLPQPSETFTDPRTGWGYCCWAGAVAAGSPGKTSYPCPWHGWGNKVMANVVRVGKS